MKIRKLNHVRVILLAAATLVFLPLSLSANPIGWSAAQDITGDSDVSTDGALVQAANITPNGMLSTTVNGVTFAPFVAASGHDISGHFTLDGSLALYDGYGSINAPFSNLSSAYQTLLSTGNNGSSNSVMTLTISGLTLGDTYQFQVWINDSRGTYGTQGITATDGALSVHILGDTTGVEGGTGQYALLTFVADGDEVITFQGDPTGGTTEEAFQLRDLTGAPTVPEGGPTMSLLAISLMGLLFFRRRSAA
jgi:hypothetical protein